MLLYFKKDESNLTLDHFERGSISKRFSSIIESINCRTAVKYGGMLSRGTGMQTVHTSKNPEIIKVILFLSNHQEECRYRNHQEKIFSSHINIFRPVLRSRFTINGFKCIKYQTLRPNLYYKRMKFPLGKIRVLHFKRFKV